MHHATRALGALATLALITFSATAAPLTVPWTNGGFELGATQWTVATTNAVADHDGDGDQEVSFVRCGDGSLQLARGAGKGIVPGNADVAFTVETGQVDFWDVRVILADTHDPEPWLNNAFGYDATGTLPADWTDDQVLSWSSWSAPLSGSVTLDPVDAVGYNIPGWSAMDAAGREAYLGGTLHGTMVFYACTSGGATLDGFAFVL